MTDYEQTSVFDLVPDGEKFKQQKSDDWKWTFSDYPQEKNGLKVFSCFACGGVQPWATSSQAVK